MKKICFCVDFSTDSSSVGEVLLKKFVEIFAKILIDDIAKEVATINKNPRVSNEIKLTPVFS